MIVCLCVSERGKADIRDRERVIDRDKREREREKERERDVKKVQQFRQKIYLSCKLYFFCPLFTL